jgi:hypothetical protein
VRLYAGSIRRPSESERAGADRIRPAPDQKGERPSRRPGSTRRPRRRRPAAILAVAVLVAAAVSVSLLVFRGGGGGGPLLVPRTTAEGDALAFTPARTAEYEQQAAFGLSHVLYAKSPDGVLVAAARTARFRAQVEHAVAGTGIDPDMLEALILLESGGRPDVIAGSDPAAAAGLTQILAETAANFLGMHVELGESRRLTRELRAAVRRGQERRAERLRARRRIVDTRFDPTAAITGAVRYLTFARARFGRDDLAFVSYHMGIGNLERVLRAYAGAGPGTAIADVVARHDLSWARIYFDSSPARHAAAWRLLSGFGDDSQTYYWRVLAAREIMRLFRRDPARLEALAHLQTRKASAEEVLHPLPTTDTFATPADVERATAERVLQPLPNDPDRLHFRLDPRLGQLAPALGRSPGLYRALRPEALALLVYLAARVHDLSGSATPLTVTSAVRDEAYQQLLVASNPEATAAYSLHTTGYAFDILRRYGSVAQARAFQYELERLQALGLIAWVREPGAIHVTVASDARTLIPAMLEPGG